MGFQHACGVTPNEVGYCWGLNEYGRLGNGTYRYSSLTPAKVKGGLRFTSISAADYHTCAIATSGLAYCWGFGSYLGGAEVYRSRLPLPVEGGLLWRQLDAGYSTCGVTTSNEGYCWGFNAEGDLGNGGTAFSTTPTPVAPPE
jgi:alpha-tubulin suppressor-like RCC1 family protein